MSVGNYAVEAHGLVLNGLVDDAGLEELFDDGRIDVNLSFTGEALYVKDNGDDDYNRTMHFNEDAIYFVPTKKWPKLVGAAPYDSMDEVVAELSASIKDIKILEGIDIRGNIRHIVGTYYG